MKVISITPANGSLAFLRLPINLLLLIFIMVSEAQPSTQVSPKPTNGPRLSTSGGHDRPLHGRHPSLPVASTPIPPVVATNPTSSPFMPTPHAPNAHRAPRPNQRGPTNSPLCSFQCDNLIISFKTCYLGPSTFLITTATVTNANSCSDIIPVVLFTLNNVGNPTSLKGGGSVDILLGGCSGTIFYAIKDKSGNSICPDRSYTVV